MNDNRPAPYDERYGVRNADVEQLLHGLGDRIGQVLPDGWGFALFLFSYGEGGSMFYLSSAQRADMVKALQEWLAKTEPVEKDPLLAALEARVYAWLRPHVGHRITWLTDDKGSTTVRCDDCDVSTPVVPEVPHA